MRNPFRAERISINWLLEQVPEGGCLFVFAPEKARTWRVIANKMDYHCFVCDPKTPGWSRRGNVLLRREYIHSGQRDLYLIKMEKSRDKNNK